jgi:hypothetical protein
MLFQAIVFVHFMAVTQQTAKHNQTTTTVDQGIVVAHDPKVATSTLTCVESGHQTQQNSPCHCRRQRVAVAGW